MARKAKQQEQEQEQRKEAQDAPAKPSIVIEFDGLGSAQFSYVMTGGVTVQQVWAAAAELNAWADFERTAQLRARKMEKMAERRGNLPDLLTMGGQVKNDENVQ